MARKPVSYLAGTVVLGTIIGAVVALLAAPKSGREVRLQLLKKSGETFQRFSGRFAHMQGPRPDVLKKLPAVLKFRNKAK